MVAAMLLSSARSFTIARRTRRHTVRSRDRPFRALALRHGLPVVYVNHVGGNDQLIFDGSSMAFNARGELCVRARSFEEDLVIFGIF